LVQHSNQWCSLLGLVCRTSFSKVLGLHENNLNLFHKIKGFLLTASTKQAQQLKQAAEVFHPKNKIELDLRTSDYAKKILAGVEKKFTIDLTERQAEILAEAALKVSSVFSGDRGAAARSKLKR
jgi:hypothetical protein